MSETYEPGDRVLVTDPGLAELRAIMHRRTGGCAPYPPAEVRALS
jgi:hypothetical protein